MAWRVTSGLQTKHDVVLWKMRSAVLKVPRLESEILQVGQHLAASTKAVTRWHVAVAGRTRKKSERM